MRQIVEYRKTNRRFSEVEFGNLKKQAAEETASRVSEER
jgi:hypothetical protein